MKSSAKQLKNKVREFRKQQKSTQEELAQALGITRQTVIAVEKGNYIPSLMLALLLANYFNKSVHDIFYIE